MQQQPNGDGRLAAGGGRGMPMDLANVNVGPDIAMAEVEDDGDDSDDPDIIMVHPVDHRGKPRPYQPRDFGDPAQNWGNGIIGQLIPGGGPEWQAAGPVESIKAPEELNFTVDSVNLDLDTHVASHAGFNKIMRLQHVARHCPQLKVDALRMILKSAQETLDVGLYTRTHEQLKTALESGLKSEDGDSTLPRLDDNWQREARRTFEGRLEMLENDLKNYKNDGMKESIWRGCEDIGNHFMMAGDACDALKSFIKAGDYCETARESSQTLANRLKACVYLRYFPQVTQMIDRMRDYDSAFERGNASAKDGKKDKEGESGDKSAQMDKRQEASLNLIRACIGIYYLSVRDYEKAADIFVALNPENCDFPSVIVGRDIALYGAICAIATYDRTKLKARVINNKTFKSFLETAPEIRRLVEAFHNSRFNEFLQGFASQKSVLLLDVFLAPHVEALYNKARVRGMIEYFRCYSSVPLTEMAQEFCWDSTTLLQEHLVKMILANQLPARIDSANQLLNRDTPDVFFEAARKIQQETDNLRRNIRFALIRTSMVRAGHCVRRYDRHVHYDPAIPFVKDLDTHVASHTGFNKIMRLQLVARHCPHLKVDALKMILKSTQETLHVALYDYTYGELETALESGLMSKDGDSTLPRKDDNWRIATYDALDAFENRLEKLENDLENYKNNGMKENVWRGYEDIGNHYMLAGNARKALNWFIKAADYCETARESSQTLANRLKACVYLRHFPQVVFMIHRMRHYDSAFERGNAPAKDGKKEKEGDSGDKSAQMEKRQEASLNLIRACIGIYYLSVRDYEKAADIFVALNPENCDFPTVIVGRDIALYGAICAVATYDRTKLKARVINNKTFKSFLETAPEIRRLVEAFHNSCFHEFLQGFNRLKSVLLLDVFLAPHVETLYNEARAHGMIEYVRGCSSSTVSLVEMAPEFCWDSTTQLQGHLVKMILAKQLPARLNQLPILPEEMLGCIFQQLDSASRRLCRRVSRTWQYTLLSKALLEHVKVDFSYLVRVRPDEFWESWSHRVIRTALVCGDEYPLKTVHFTDESNADAPWKRDAPRMPQRSLDELNALLCALALNCCCRQDQVDEFYNGASEGLLCSFWTGKLPQRLIFSRIVLPASAILWFFETRERCDRVFIVEFRDVKVVDVDIRALYGSAFAEGDIWMSRIVDCEFSVGKGQPEAKLDFFSELGRRDADLSAAEEQEYRDLVGDLRPYVDLAENATLQLRNVLEEFFGDVSVSQIMEGRLSPFVKRLIIAVKVFLDLWEQQAQAILQL